MKLLCSPVTAFFRYYSSNAKLIRPYWGKYNKSKNTIKGEEKDCPKAREPRIKWTEEQSEVLKAISEGKSVFISGSAGTGKTVLVKHIIKKLKSMHGRSKVFVTASTGVAACALNGMTLHSFVGAGFGDADLENMLFNVQADRRANRRWNNAKALVIDEVSMITASFFEKIEYIARELRGETNFSSKDKLWGGIQLVVSGDFFQLPPVIKKENKTSKEYAFEADCWDASFDLQIELTKVFRQSEANLVKLLQGIRRGESDPEDLELLKQCCSLPEDDPSAVQLFPRIDDVNRVNRRKLLSLDEEIIAYNALDFGGDPWKKQLNSGIAPEKLEICTGARVMLCKNIRTSGKLVNGATGTVVGFVNETDNAGSQNSGNNKNVVTDTATMCSHGCFLPVVKFDFGKEFIVEPETWFVMDGDKVVAKRKQIPLVLAWALSIHKCQGMTIERLHTDLHRAFGCGMVYVALSRVKTLEGLHLSLFSPKKIKADGKVLKFYQNLSLNHCRENGGAE